MNWAVRDKVKCMGGSKIKLRWLAVVPLSLLAGALVLFPIHWLAQIYQILPDFGEPMITDASGRSIFKTMQLQDLERLGQALVVPATVILVAAYVAPRARFFVSLVMSVLVGFFLVYPFFVAAKSPDLDISFGTIPAWIMGVLWAISIGGAVFKTYHDRPEPVESLIALDKDEKGGAYLGGFATRRATSIGPQGYGVPFMPGEVDWFHEEGTASIRGYTGGASVSLVPRSPYAERHMWTVFGSTEGGYFPSEALVEVTEGSPKNEAHRSFIATRKKTSVENGQFSFQYLPEGEYFVWSHIGAGKRSVMRAVRLGKGQAASVNLL